MDEEEDCSIYLFLTTIHNAREKKIVDYKASAGKLWKTRYHVGGILEFLIPTILLLHSAHRKNQSSLHTTIQREAGVERGAYRVIVRSGNWE